MHQCMLFISFTKKVVYCVSLLILLRFQSQSEGAITFKVVPGIKEEAQNKEPKVQFIIITADQT